jgi:hypothetical protein
MSLVLDSRPVRQALPNAEWCAHAAGLRRFSTWQGASGRRYIFTAYAIDECPDIENAVALAVRVTDDGRRQALACLELGAFPALALGGATLKAAQQAGATELHLHLLATTPEAGRNAVFDLSGSAVADT